MRIWLGEHETLDSCQGKESTRTFLTFKRTFSDSKNDWKFLHDGFSWYVWFEKLNLNQNVFDQLLDKYFYESKWLNDLI